MKVDKKLLEKWKDLALHGDAELISESMPEDTRVTGQTIRTLIRTGEYRSLNVLEAVIAFYKERERKVKGLMNDALNGAENEAEVGFKIEYQPSNANTGASIIEPAGVKAAKVKASTNNTFLEKRRNAKNKIQ